MGYAIVIILGIVVDQISKWAAATYLQPVGSIEVIPNFFYLTYVENRGAAWSFLSDVPWGIYVLTGMSALSSLLFIYLLIKAPTKRLRWTLSVITAGTIGNLIDRARLGHVIDFADFRFGDYVFPTFNVADSMLVIGVILLVFFLSMEKEPEAALAEGGPEEEISLDRKG